MVGVQAEACSPYVDSLAARRPIGARSANTICDGIAVKRPGELTEGILKELLDDVVTVSDDEIAAAISSSETVTTSSRSSFRIPSVSSPGRLTAIPSQIVLADRAPIGRRAASEST